ncbi:hypothetical protein BJ742DRAFT_825999 [Cladochytrium replicatum]|nr:hypothetical protein BJ742DRAFT_825999 [Cladochytrium replicatum]
MLHMHFGLLDSILLAGFVAPATSNFLLSTISQATSKVLYSTLSLILSTDWFWVAPDNFNHSKQSSGPVAS